MDLDIYHFINSADMRKYLRDISYQFSISEAMFVVYWSKRATLSEKVSAWKDIISSMPDCALKSRHVEFESYHSVWESYICLIGRDIDRFYDNSDEQGIYSYKYHEPDTDRWCGNPNLFFPDYQSCYAAIQQELSDSGEGEIDKIQVYKYLLNRHTRPSSLLMNSELEVLEINSYPNDINEYDISCAIEDCCFNFPSPFQRGDIVVSYAMKTDPQHRPFVLRYMTTWDSKELTEQGFCFDREWPWREDPEKLDKHITGLLNEGDYTDMYAIGYCVDCEDGVVYADDTMILVIDLEYYRGPLEGFERQLKLFSYYEKGKASDIPVSAEMLVNGCFAIRTEELAKKIVSDAATWYLKDDLLRLGVICDAKENTES